MFEKSALLDFPDDFFSELRTLGRTPQVASDSLPLLDHLQKKNTFQNTLWKIGVALLDQLKKESSNISIVLHQASIAISTS